MRVPSLFKIIAAGSMLLLAVVITMQIQSSSKLTPRERLLSYVDNTISKINSEPYKNYHTSSFGKPSTLIIDSLDHVYTANDGEERMQIDNVEYLKNVRLYTEALREPAEDLGIDSNFSWLSHPLKLEAAKQMRSEMTISFENDRKVYAEAPLIKYSKSKGSEFFEIEYPASLEIKHFNLGGQFTGKLHKRLEFKKGVLASGQAKPSGDASKHLPETTLQLTFKDYKLEVPEKVLKIDDLRSSPKFMKAQNTIIQRVFLGWVLRVALSKSNRNGGDYSTEVLGRVIEDFYKKRYLPPRTSLQIINGKANMTTFLTDDKNIQDSNNVISCGTIESGAIVITEGPCSK